MSACIFCEIVKKNISATVAFEDDEIIAFDDINPVAPVHILVVPKIHIQDLSGLDEEDGALAGKMLLVASRLARERGVLDSGFRIVINSGKEGGQIVMHLHLHVIGGKQLGHKMG